MDLSDVFGLGLQIVAHAKVSPKKTPAKLEVGTAGPDVLRLTEIPVGRTL